jgi:hypothetical protein
MSLRVAVAALALGASAGAWAGMPTFCERPNKFTAADQDRVLRFAGVVKQELERSGARVALISRAGIALRDASSGAWSIRQLYYACDDARPHLFDQGVAGFTLGAEAPSSGHVSIVFLPDQESALLERAAADKRMGLALLAGEYSANAYAFGTRYQNCNQWVAELIASAWGGLDGQDRVREHAQSWLREQGYAAGPVRVPSHWMMFAGQFVPLVHVADHPVDDLHALALQVSVPASIEDFARRHAPTAQRVELCHDEGRVVVRRGWEQIGAQCRPLPDDEIIAIEP